MLTRLTKAKASAEPGVMSGSTFITESGVTSVTLRPHPGGWAEFGHDDERTR
ncbi:hypothetical protein GCM10025864_24380 [Luteimicrobium album]|uniref:Uncharacterized protein n=1 Tax=Luteimicrobium album TaxID=1054550 RepID=A0ABQ6I4D0_9MICO|nr:hypothetical protein GCM10025864_24380 [Luteimicrobium album]